MRIRPNPTLFKILIGMAIASYLAGCGGNKDADVLNDHHPYKADPTPTPQVLTPYETSSTNYNAIFSQLTSEHLIGNDRIDISSLKAISTADPSKRFNVTPEIKTRIDKTISPSCATQGIDSSKRVYAFVTFDSTNYRKIKTCYHSEKKYGSFWVQDDTGGMLVIRDGKTDTYKAGELVSFEVLGTYNSYGTLMVFMQRDIKKVLDANGKPITLQSLSSKIYAKPVSTIAEAKANTGNIISFKNLTVVNPPTNYNFSTICTIPDSDPLPTSDADAQSICSNPNKHIDISLDKKWLAGFPFDKPFTRGEHIDVAGPVEISYKNITVFVRQNGQLTIK